MENIKIVTPYIKLDQLLKFGGIAENGADAKIMIKEGCVYLNGEKELKRGKKVFSGDIIKICDGEKTIEIKVCE